MKKSLPLLILLTLLLISSKKTVLATDPHFFLSPSSGSYSQAFSVDIKIDSGGQAVSAADIYLEYPKNLLKAEKVSAPASNEAVFDEVLSSIKNEGKVAINAMFSTAKAGDSYTGSNKTIAKVDFTPLGAGTVELKFTCSPGSTTESNIASTDTLKDIILCSANSGGSYTLTSSGGSTPNPTATPTQGSSSGGNSSGGSSSATATPKPTVPVSGSVTQTIGLIGLGIITLLTGLVLTF